MVALRVEHVKLARQLRILHHLSRQKVGEKGTNDYIWEAVTLSYVRGSL